MSEETVNTISNPPATANSDTNVNNSIVTAIGSHQEEENDSLITSPIPEQKIPNSTTDDNINSRLSNEFKTIIEEKSKELSTLLYNISKEINKEDIKDLKLTSLNDDVNNNNHFNWEKIVEVSEMVFNEYSKDMELVTKELDELNKEFLIWQESTYILDSEKISKRLNGSENWINKKENYLNYLKNELTNSAELINDALKKLDNNNNNNNNNN
ncbi:hypothetical protein WICMUC_003156 [Wickerhamomyces mucosus]|uniref:Grand meiotic recombination cluster protein 2 n=1 Tax=Wickerhamomyces mucosus TaxID=1378264 RepID=A0A9P8PNB0_9ASCO|nr:hypothetical protein WICMUC_003156 [Wickerhamomyces mucosus]